MAKNSSTSYSSMKRLLFALGLLTLLASTEFTAVDGRALRSTTNNVVVAGCGEQGGADEQAAVSTFAVSANNSSSRPSVRSLAFKLASGPSKRGPGH